jgi:hypothetical protein
LETQPNTEPISLYKSVVCSQSSWWGQSTQEKEEYFHGSDKQSEGLWDILPQNVLLGYIDYFELKAL